MTVARRWLTVEVEVDLPAAEDPATRDERLGWCADALHDAGSLGCEELMGLADGARSARLRAYFAPDASLAAIGRCLEVALGSAARIRGSGEIADPGWVEQWNASLTPVEVGRRWTIVPGEGEAAPGRLALHVAPGRAFGTGHHESTRLALEWLELTVSPGDRVLDVGTGTGILAMAAARLGASRVLATDDDAEAIDVARGNLAGLPERAVVELVVGAGTAQSRELHEVVVANITSDVLLPLVGELAARIVPGGALVLAGLLTTDEHPTDRALAAAGLGDGAWRRAGEWSAVRARRGQGTP